MEKKNQKTSCPKAVCEKIFRAITFGPAFSTIRRISSRQPTPNSSPAKLHARNSPNNSVKVTPPQRPKHKEGSELVAIKFDYTTPPNGSSQAPLARMAHQAKTAKPPSTGMVQPGKPTSGVASRIGADQKSGNNGQIQVQFERNKEEAGGKKLTHYDDTFSAFIHRTKKRMSHDQEQYGENNSPKGDGNHGHGHHKDHHFSDFIDKTKRKIRTTSSLKDRSESFFK